MVVVSFMCFFHDGDSLRQALHPIYSQVGAAKIIFAPSLRDLPGTEVRPIAYSASKQPNVSLYPVLSNSLGQVHSEYTT